MQFTRSIRIKKAQISNLLMPKQHQLNKSNKFNWLEKSINST
ncbi:hypothetical protein P20652_2477 [Pseudoalteromonas sp. BSi20652]|nr:hypothetical protein P20652_2477 [Pseudoalteromonas sp. BSi20652]